MVHGPIIQPISESQKKRSSRLMVERQPDLLAHLRQASGVGVDRAFRFAGGAGGVEDEGAVLGIERGGCEMRRLVLRNDATRRRRR